MGYFYSTSVSIGWYFSLENGPFTYGKNCVLGVDLRTPPPQFWGFSFDQPRGHNLLCQKFRVRGGQQQRINNGVAGLDSVLQSRPLGDF